MDSTQIVKLEMTRFDAIRQHDVESLNDLMHPDFVFIHSSGRIDSKSTYLDLLRSNRLRYTRVETRDIRVIAVADTLAQVFLMLNFTADFGGSEVSVNAALLSTWTRDKSRWQVISTQSTTVPVT